MMAHDAQSTRWRGSDMSTASRVSSSVLAPSLMSITSGWLSITGLIALSAVQWFMGIAVEAVFRRSANDAFFIFDSACSEATHSGSAAIVLPASPARIASSAILMSPTTGAAIGTLRSISRGSTSSWMNLMPGFHLPRPNDSIQLRRAPTTITTSAFSMMVLRHDSALSGPASGIRPLAIDMAR